MMNEEKVLKNIELDAALSDENSQNLVTPEIIEDEVISAELEDSSMENIISVLQAEIAKQEELLEEQTQKAEQATRQYLMIAADFDNFRKRTEKEKEEQDKKGKRQTIIELLPVVDNFERARNQIKTDTDGEKAIHSSYQGVYKNLVDAMKKLGVSAMRPEGEMFDPQYHEAMLREPTNEYPEGTVIEQLIRGYTLGDQVLRHAMVKVATPLDVATISEQENVEQE